jgi:hypothetical protein
MSWVGGLTDVVRRAICILSTGIPAAGLEIRVGAGRRTAPKRTRPAPGTYYRRYCVGVCLEWSMSASGLYSFFMRPNVDLMHHVHQDVCHVFASKPGSWVTEYRHPEPYGGYLAGTSGPGRLPQTIHWRRLEWSLTATSCSASLRKRSEVTICPNCNIQ